MIHQIQFVSKYKGRVVFSNSEPTGNDAKYLTLELKLLGKEMQFIFVYPLSIFKYPCHLLRPLGGHACMCLDQRQNGVREK